VRCRFAYVREDGDMPNAAGRLLCARRDRPRRRAAERCDELASPHIGSQAQERALYPLKQVF
jgi:hypothetical protein